MATLGLIVFLVGQIALLVQVQKLTWRLLAPVGAAARRRAQKPQRTVVSDSHAA